MESAWFQGCVFNLVSCLSLNLLNRSLDAFNVCPFGESRVYTDPKVGNRRDLLWKTQIFGTESYDEAHRHYATYNPGFKFVELLGADLLVVGVLVCMWRRLFILVFVF